MTAQSYRNCQFPLNNLLGGNAKEPIKEMWWGYIGSDPLTDVQNSRAPSGKSGRTERLNGRCLLLPTRQRTPMAIMHFHCRFSHAPYFCDTHWSPALPRTALVLAPRVGSYGGQFAAISWKMRSTKLHTTEQKQQQGPRYFKIGRGARQAVEQP